MPSNIPENFETVSPSQTDVRLALDSSRQLAASNLGRCSSVQIQVAVEKGGVETLTVPTSALRMLLHCLTEMAQGNAVTLIPTHAELTTQQAADLLNVSRPYLAKLLDEGKIPSRTVGRFRRARFEDVMRFKSKDDADRAKAIAELTEEAQRLGLGY